MVRNHGDYRYRDNLKWILSGLSVPKGCQHIEISREQERILSKNTNPKINLNNPLIEWVFYCLEESKMAQESRLVIVIDAKNAERNARNLGNELDSIERKGDFATKSMDGLSVATRQLAGYMAGLVTVSAAISKMDTYTGLQNRLKLVTNNQVELNKATEDTFRIAQKTYSAWDSVLQVYQRFSDNAKTLNLTMDDTARLTETVSKAVAISGASDSAADAALVQFGQALASGTLRGEELNSVMEQTPALAKAIAQGMGITVGELRSVAAEGKITSQEIVKALRNVEKDVDALFAKTDITIGQSLTLLNNEITKFVGESGKGSGAAQVLAGTIQTLAGNLDVLTSAMMVGGAYWLGTYIPAIYASGVAVAAKTKELAVQTVTQYAAIQAERAAAAQQVISTQAVVANTQATLAAIAAEKALEVQRLKSQITEKGRTATLTRMAELKKIEAQVTRELAVAEGALATAQARSAAAGAASVGIGSRLLGLLGGPVGIGITVASLAAGYLLMRGNGDQANKMLGDQSRYASLATGELEKLSGAQLRAAEKELSNQLMLQSGHLQKAKNDFEALTESVLDSNKGNQEAYRIWAELRTGVITTEQAFNKLNQAKFVTSDQINALADSQSKIIQHEDAVKKLNEQLNKTRESGANAANGIKAIGNAADETKVSIEVLNKALGKLTDQRTDSQYVMNTAKNLGGDIEKAKALLEYRKQLGLGSVGRQLTPQERKPFEDSYAALRALKAYEDNIAESKKTSLKLSKQQTSEYEKQAREASRIKEEQFKSREDIYYKYATREMKIEKDLQSEIAKIQGSNFSPKDTAGYISNAQSRSQLEVLLYKAQLDSELNDWKQTEQEKLNHKVYVNELMIQLDSDMNEEQKKQAIQSLIGRSNQELAWLRLEQKQRLLESSRFYMSDAEYMQERYQLERDEIAKNMQLSQQERDARIAMLHAEEEFEKRKNLKSASLAWGQSYADMTGSGARFQIEQDRFNRYEESNALFESQIALAETAAEREAIWQAHHERMTAIESAYQQGSYGLQLGYGEQVTGALSNMLGTMLGESSSTYQALFYAQRSFALAQAGMNVWKAASDAYANEPGTWYQKAAAAAIATIKSGTFVSLIQAATPQGFSSGGYTGNMGRGDVAGVVHGQEYVLNAAATKRVGVDTLNAINSGGSLERTVSSSGQPVTIQVYVTDSGVNTNGANTQDQKQLGQMIGNAVRTVIRQEQRQGGLLAR